MANCCNCAAPLPPHSIVCDYCGSRNDTDLKGVHRYTTGELSDHRTCPRCAIPLRTIDLELEGRFLIERCDQCLGLFFDPGELETLLQSTVTNVHAINRKQLDSLVSLRTHSDFGVTYIRCPVCTTVMSRVNFGTRSGVVVDRCPDHGVWLDGGELRQLFEWTKAGGGLLEQQRQEERQREEARKQEPRQRTLLQAKGVGVLEREVPDGMFGTREPDLLSLLQRLARWLT